MSRRALAVAGVALVFSFFFVTNSYMNDDAFLAFRTVDNFVRGDGLRWNVAERVQSFTSPLYTLLTAAVYKLTYDPSPRPNPHRMYVTAMAMSYVLSLFAVGSLVWGTRRLAPALLTVLLLMSSQAFVTFTSSGLETPLIYLLVVLFYRRFLGPELETPRELFWLLLLASLAVVNRVDSALLFAPAAAYLLFRGFRSFGLGALRPVLLASLPMIAWFGFALVYFGFLLPNTYYAKLGLEVDPAILSWMGRAYLELNLLQDPITLFAIGAGLCLSPFGAKTALAGLSIALHLAYVYSIGGDNLGFRFLAPPFLLSALVIHHFFDTRTFRHADATSAATAVALLLYGAVVPGSPLRALRDPPNIRSVSFYFDASNLARWRPGERFPFARFHRIRTREECQTERRAADEVSILGGGLGGFCAGPEHHLVMPVGLTDPLVARLPALVRSPFYPGHVVRAMPAGYIETLETGENHIEDPALAAYQDRIARITRGPLFDAERWRDIAALNFTTARTWTQPYVESDPPYPARFSHRHPSLVEVLSEYKSRRAGGTP